MDNWPCIVLQVDLGLLRFVTAVGTQGAISKETKKKYYVKTYRIEISSNGEDWVTIKEGNKPVVSLAATPSTNSVFEMDGQFYLFVWELSVWPGLFLNWFKMKSAIRGLNLTKGSHVPRSRSQKQITRMCPRKVNTSQIKCQTQESLCTSQGDTDHAKDKHCPLRILENVLFGFFPLCFFILFHKFILSSYL